MAVTFSAMMRRRLLLLVPSVLLAAGLAGIGVWREGRPAAEPDIGGPFRLIAGDGRGITEQSLLGRTSLVYFGYTHCPDACPTALQDMASAVDKLSASERKQVQILFITVDPARDTPGVMQSYVSAFGPDVEGLTGSPGAIAQAAREYRVYYARHEEKNGDYSMDHSSIIYLMNKKGRFVRVFTAQDTPDEVASELRKLVG
jgi:protein SCO1/2